jgi:hypothetical protein
MVASFDLCDGRCNASLITAADVEAVTNRFISIRGLLSLSSSATTSGPTGSFPEVIEATSFASFGADKPNFSAHGPFASPFLLFTFKLFRSRFLSISSRLTFAAMHRVRAK